MSNIKNHFLQVIIERRIEARSLTESFEQALSIARLDDLANPSYKKIYDATIETLEMVEHDGHRKALLGLEPHYHNRQHFADACLALGFFLQAADLLGDYQKLLLMLTMLVHDFGHQGSSNKPTARTQEEETVRLIQSSPLINLNKNDFNFVSTLIIGTTPKNLSAVNARYLRDTSNTA